MIEFIYALIASNVLSLGLSVCLWRKSRQASHTTPPNEEFNQLLSEAIAGRGIVELQVKRLDPQGLLYRTQRGR